MEVTKRIHAIKIPFKIPLSQERSIDRFAFVYLVFGNKIHLIVVCRGMIGMGK